LGPSLALQALIRQQLIRIKKNPMQAEQLKALQGAVKQKYRDNPAAAVVQLHSRGTIHLEPLTCRVETVRGAVDAGLHSAAGGDGQGACSGDMLLDALVACAGVTLSAVASAMSIPLRGGTITATGEMDFRGTLGVSKETPVGLTKINLQFSLDTDAPREQIEKLIQLTERYCVIYQTLKQPPALTSSLEIRA
jgi:uncharacterized OsmC-like protein